VIVPDGILRTLPFAALHDGERYLVEKKILATTTALQLTNNSPANSSAPTILLNGLTNQGEDPLWYVAKELEAIQKWFSRHRMVLLQDENFTKANFLGKVKRESYSLIHIASHGKFGRVEESFLATVEANSPLQIPDLTNLAYWGDYRNQPVELLTLSACETSSGNDEEAALGMSGLTVTAGAKTVVGSLWRVDDSSTCYLMEAFYRQYASGVPTAKALQQAQLQLLLGNFDQTTSICGESSHSSETYRQPYYWAGFLVIGNWK
jgi:CHAT domain-containing protein